MSRVVAERIGRVGGAAARALPAVVCALGLAGAARAQDSGALRGALSEAAIPPPHVVRLTPAETAALAARPLPQAANEPVATTPVEAIESEADLAVDRAQRAEAIEGLEGAAEERPFEAVGLRAGTFILKPTLEQGLTATTNADSSADGDSAVIRETILRLNAASDWASHSATIDAYGIFRKSISGDEVKTNEGGVDAALELELGKDYRARAELGFTLAPESASSPTAVADARSQPLRRTISGGLGLEKDAGKARFGIAGRIEDDSYGDAELEGGGTLSQRERDATLYALELRAGYEVSPALTPFVAAEIGRRVHDLETDSAGYARSSDRLGLRTGLAFDRGEKLSGEVSAGWIREEFDDGRLAPISGLSIDGEVAWSPVRGTTIALAGSTAVEGATNAGESGSILYSADLSLKREMRADLTGEAALGAAYRDYAGCGCYDVILSGEVGLTWWLNRYAGLTGRLRHEELTSNAPGRDTKTSSVFVGMKLQR